MPTFCRCKHCLQLTRDWIRTIQSQSLCVMLRKSCSRLWSLTHHPPVLLQPPPETYDLFDDIMLLADGALQTSLASLLLQLVRPMQTVIGQQLSIVSEPPQPYP